MEGEGEDVADNDEEDETGGEVFGAGGPTLLFCNEDDEEDVVEGEEVSFSFSLISFSLLLFAFFILLLFFFLWDV